MQWQVVILNHAVAAEMNALPVDLRAKMTRVIDLLETYGPHNVREPYVKPLGGKLWEMRMKGQHGITRAIYVAASGRRLIVLHAFVKKTQRTPRRAIELARRRAMEIEP